MNRVRSSRKGRTFVILGATALTTGVVAAGVYGVSDNGKPEARKAAPVARNAAVLAMPAFRLPFPCGQTWTGNSSNSSAHTRFEIDFNRGRSAEADNGDTVVASAPGRVIRSTRHVNQSGFGNHVVIQHSGGYTSWYAHLKYRSVSVGQSVNAGQKIGALGRTTRPGNSGMSSHLHYEVRLNGAYPPVAAHFGGKRFGYPQQTLRACGGGTGPAPAPSPVARICGSGFKQIDSATLKGGKVYLGYRAGVNCVVTVKPKGSKARMSATLQVKGGKAITDSGLFSMFAGSVKASAGKKCVMWGGAIGSSKYTSPKFEHCG